MEFIESIEIFIDAIIILGAFWIAYLFRRTYRRSAERRSAVLSILFALLGLYFSVQILMINVLDLEQFEWMESHEALEVMLLAMLVSLAVVLTVGASWQGTRLKPKSREEEKAA